MKLRLFFNLEFISLGDAERMKMIKYLVIVLLVIGLTACSSRAKKNAADASAAADTAAAATADASAAAIKKDPTVADIQEALNSAGAKLKADGKMGKATRRAIREYQKKNKLKVTGNADEATLKSLGLK
jgi:peptidoglycan hydrolase-like protein with peptidoglycan-binding domain